MTTETATVVRLTDGALERILDLRSGETDGDSLALRIEVTGSNGSDYTYDLSFEPVDEVGDGHHVSVQSGLSVVVPDDSIDQLAGATLDLPANPNRPNPLGGGLDELELTGELPEKVQQLLDQQINPALASHGGMAELVGVQDDRVYIRMGGGCQGCSLSMMTLRDGITTMIKDALPEVTEVVDLTDHDAGENPFYS